MISLLLIGIVASWVPLAIIARERATPQSKPRIQIIQDMGSQVKYGAQAPSPVFADGRSARASVPGTVARGFLRNDDHYERGYVRVHDAETGKWTIEYFAGFPTDVAIDATLLKRGQERFGIYCAPCHGYDGAGHGTVNERAFELRGQPWVQAMSIHQDEVREREDGHIYNTIRNGIRTMPGYASQIDTHDRWAIVAYVRALQRSQNATLDDIPLVNRDTLR